MFLKSAFNATRFLLSSTVLLLAMPQSGLSQISTDEAIDTLDEIVVYGQPTLRLLRNEVHEAEENFYELFNALNNGRQFDVRCFHRKPLGTLITKRICEAYFVKNPMNGVSHYAYFRHKTKQMRQEMAELVGKHPELHAALLAYVDAKQSFNASFLERCDRRFSFCQN